VDELATLVRRVQAGDQEVYAEIVCRLQDMAVGYSYAILGDFHWAQDAAQEVFIEAYRNIAKLREPCAFPGWLRKIAFKHCDRLMRGKRVRIIPLDAAARIVSGDLGPAEAAAQRELRSSVWAAVQDLPEAERLVVTLFFMGAYS
jgi:RNA polymerase sigma factor (sigma-70 family)